MNSELRDPADPADVEPTAPGTRQLGGPEHLEVAPDGYLLLLAPSSNRVYAGDAARLNAAEITLLADAFDLAIDVRPVDVAGVDYLAITSRDDASGAAPSRDGVSSQERERLTRLISEASGAFALFEANEGLLRPSRLVRRRLYTDDLVTIQKYQGKTNEQFTHLLLNVTAALAKRPAQLLDGSLQVLDPMCGRGTTLNTCLLRGLEVTGVDVDKGDFEQYQAFITTWLRTHRLKHALDTTQVRRNGETFGRALEMETAPTKQAWKAGETQQVTYLNLDTTKLGRVMRRASIDVIVTDTPYGIQHGSHGERLDRSPLHLLQRALPGWHDMLRSGGTLGLAYNRHVAPPEQLAETLEDHGFEVVHGVDVAAPRVAADAFRHRVDASIDRDIMVARKN